MVPSLHSGYQVVSQVVQQVALKASFLFRASHELSGTLHAGQETQSMAKW